MEKIVHFPDMVCTYLSKTHLALCGHTSCLLLPSPAHKIGFSLESTTHIIAKFLDGFGCVVFCSVFPEIWRERIFRFSTVSSASLLMPVGVIAKLFELYL